MAVFPAPTSPTMATSWPGSTRNSSSLSADRCDCCAPTSPSSSLSCRSPTRSLSLPSAVSFVFSGCGVSLEDAEGGGEGHQNSPEEMLTATLSEAGLGGSGGSSSVAKNRRNRATEVAPDAIFETDHGKSNRGHSIIPNRYRAGKMTEASSVLPKTLLGNRNI